MKQLPEKDRRKAMDVLAKCATATSGITDPKELNDAVYAILHEAFPNQPQMIKRACQAYNSAKSIHKLSTADDSNRGDDFSILDPNAMCKRAMDESIVTNLKKAASACGIRTVSFSKDPEKPMAKAASAHNALRKEAAKQPQKPIGEFQLKGLVREALDGYASTIRKFASAGNVCARTFEYAKKEFIRKMASVHSEERKKAAELLCAYYGDAGKSLVVAYNEAEPLNKVASYSTKKYKGSVSLPNTELYKAASACIHASDELIKSENRSMLMLDTALSFIKGVLPDNGLSKQAAGVVTPVSAAAAALGVGSVKEIPELMGLDDPSEDKIRAKIYDTEVLNLLKEHSVRRAFMDMLLDQSIQKYPLDKVLAAYNASLKETPISMRGVPDTANLGLLKSRTLALLGRGGVPSAGDADTIMNIQKVYGRIDPATFVTKPTGDDDK